MMTRRGFGLLGLAELPLPGQTAELTAWTPGQLDMHHISTGRASCAFFVLPDGTSMLVDAGDNFPRPGTEQFIIDHKPNASRRPGEWMGRYISRHLKAAGRNELDYCLLTHFHSDHMGQVGPGLPKSKKGDYLLTGIADVAELVPVKHFVDRCYPDYSYPIAQNDPHTMNYRALLKVAQAGGAKVERFRVGSGKQFPLQRQAGQYPGFSIRNLAANGEVWTGQGDGTRQVFPTLSALQAADYPNENMCSIAFRMSYGKFDYFGGGDICQDTRYGKYPWRDMETPAAEAAGKVEVALANHHGYIDSMGPSVIRALQAKAYVIHAWDSAHPTMPALHNMLSQDLYSGPRDVFATAMKAENAIAIRQVSQMKSTNGHVVVRVSPGGDDFRIFVTSNADETDRVVGTFGPYRCA
jgi:hypothetical protein